MTSTSFLSENQSFSQANSSWASLIVDQVQNSIEDEDYSNILDFSSDPAGRSTSVESHGRSKQHVDMRTFEQILQVMIQQGAGMDRLREELDQLRQESQQELDDRNARLRLAEKQLRSLQSEKNRALAELEELQEELGVIKASEEEEPTSSDVLTLEEHNRIVHRIKDDARARIENFEAEKSYLTLQLSRLQIQVAQLKNQVEDRSYPDEVVEELTKTLRDTVIETCKNADIEAQKVKQELTVLQGHVARYERQLQLENAARANAENELTMAKESLEELHAEYDAVQERLAISESMQGQANEAAVKEAQEQVEQLQAQLFEFQKAREVVESELHLAMKAKEAEEEATRQLRDQIVSLSASLTGAEAKATKEAELRSNMEKTAECEKNRLLEEISRLEDGLEAARKQIADLEDGRSREQVEAKARQKQIDELQENLKQTKRGNSEVLRENERIRMLYAEAEGNRAEADILNEELRQKISELEEEVKKVSSLESDLQNTKAQLAQAMESMNVAKDQASSYSLETNQLRTEIAELRAENEQLIAARRQMAAIYGLPAEPMSSPRNTPTRVVPPTPIRRSSQSLSPSTSSVAPQLIEYPTPPLKRRRVSRLSTTGSTSGAVAGSSPASAIFLDDGEEKIVAQPTTPTHKDPLSTNGSIPKHLHDVLTAFTKLASWNDDDDRPVCGFCALHSHYNEKDRRAPLNFSPSQYPLTFWNHCLICHKDALRPNIDVWLGADTLKLPASETFSFNDLPAVLARFVSWKKSEATYACGLCELEKRRDSLETLKLDPSTEPIVFWTHCHKEHVHFWKPVG